MPRWLIAASLLAVGACEVDQRPEQTTPTEPFTPPPPAESRITGSYEATQLVVQRVGSAKNLIGEPDTRISLHLNDNGITRGQLKIGSDPDFRAKVPLDGRWRLLLPSNRVTFDFVRETFIGEIAFHIQTSGLSGDWVSEGVRIHVQLEKVD